MDVRSQLNTALAGRYDVEREIGRGGMATVYLARDVRHNRRVALKLLNPELGAILGVERFLAEIEVTANLQHPNLLPLFDSGQADGLLFYVMPFVDGESLRAKLQREKQLPIDEAVSIAVAVANALDYAHRHGVIHRDLKPENILLHEGQPLVADFGIALAVSNAGGNRITQTGLSLGTPQYMSPEQATGDRVIDARTDIYSLSAVLYEMLVGDPPHLAGTSQAIIAKVLTERPRGVRVSRPAVSPQIEATVARALEKLPADRFATARDMSDALMGRANVASVANAGESADDAPRVGMRSTIWRYAIGAAVMLAGVGLGAAMSAWHFRQATRPTYPVRFTLALPPDARLRDVAGSPFALSPDGSVLAYVAGANRAIYVRRMEDFVARPVPGTELAELLSFSPDGKWIAFWSGQLKKVAVDGGSSTTLASVGEPQGISWNAGDRIVISFGGDLLSVPSGGGIPTVLLHRDTVRHLTRMWPRVLSDGKTVLFVNATMMGPPTWQLGVATIDGQSETGLDLFGANVLGVVERHLVYASASGTILAVPFDVSRRRVLGGPVPIIENVLMGGNASVKASLSDAGSIVYQIGFDRSQLTLVASGGASVPLTPEQRLYSFPRYSPDGKRIAVTIRDGPRTDVWLYEVASGTLQRLTDADASRPEWTPDGRRVVFRRVRNGSEQIWWQRADASAPAESLYAGPNPIPEALISPDGKYLVYRINHPKTGRDIRYRPLSGDTTPGPIAVTEFDELMPRISPDGKWIVYVSEASGKREVYARPFPGAGAVVQLSSGGGDEPLWSRDGKRVFYRWSTEFTAASLAFDADGVRVLSREKLFEGLYPFGSIHQSWDVAPDGRFLVTKSPADNFEILVVHDWRSELLARLRAAR